MPRRVARSCCACSGIVDRPGADADVDALADADARPRRATRGRARRPGATPTRSSPRWPARRGRSALLDLLLRAGPYGDGFGAHARRPDARRLEAQPHGIDLGPLEPRIPELLRTPSGKIELAPEPLAADVRPPRAGARRAPADELVLIGRRQLRSNNSWMHNVPSLVKGKPRCTLLVNSERRRAPRPRRRRPRAS